MRAVLFLLTLALSWAFWPWIYNPILRAVL
jgi:hypothetical protein